jgi:hypothetical protein
VLLECLGVQVLRCSGVFRCSGVQVLVDVEGKMCREKCWWWGKLGLYSFSVCFSGKIQGKDLQRGSRESLCNLNRRDFDLTSGGWLSEEVKKQTTVVLACVRAREKGQTLMKLIGSCCPVLHLLPTQN